MVVNTTLANRTKRARLENERKIPQHHIASKAVATYLLTLNDIEGSTGQILCSIGRQLLLQREVGVAAMNFLETLKYKEVNVGDVPRAQFDLLGSAYQYLTTKAENLDRGAFYTGPQTAKCLVGSLTFNNNEIILDPACGSGILLLLSDAPADRIVGVDNDPIAVMIAKFNYFLKFPDGPPPKIYCDDFFVWFLKNKNLRYNYVVANPPFGARVENSVIERTQIRSGESFSYFVELGYALLASGGLMRYLLPSAALNIPRHSDLRDFLFDKANCRRIAKLPQKFSGVMSDIFLVEIAGGSSERMVFQYEGSEVAVEKAFLDKTVGRILTPWSEIDKNILEKIDQSNSLTLAGSTFGLGVVTGDNKGKLLASPTASSEPIYTGKEVLPYKLLPPKFHLEFDRARLQQVAPDDVYRAPEKLVYKVIGYNLKFAYDASQSLTTNSANILIPNIPGYGIRTVMAMLNSDLYSFLYRKLFGEVNKIAKKNLVRLPFPRLSLEQRATIDNLVVSVIEDEADCHLQDYIHQEVCGLSVHEVRYVRQAIGKGTQGSCVI